MRKHTLLFCWITVSLVLQFFIFAFIDRVYLPGRTSGFEVERYDQTDDLKENGEVEVPQDINDIKVSYDGRYVGYLSEGSLELLSLYADTEKMTIHEDNYEITYFKWLPDRHVVIYAMKLLDGDEGYVRIDTYDTARGAKRTYPYIENLPLESKITDIELSTFTNMVYVRIKTSETEVKMYRYNIVEELEYLASMGSDSAIKLMNYKDILVFEEKGRGVFVRYGVNGKIEKLNFNKESVLLAVDEEDNIYIGELDEQKKVTEIYYGRFNAGSDKTWKKFDLVRPSFPNDIVITHQGGIYIINSTNKLLYCLNNNTRISYTGKLIGIFNNKIVTLDNNIVRLQLTQKSSYTDG